MVRRGMAAALCAAALLLSGCSDDPPEPKPIDPDEQTDVPSSPTTPTSPTVSATPEPPRPEDTIREFVRVQNEMERTGDATDFLALGYKCDYCRKYARLVEGIYKRGGVMNSAGWTIRSITRQPARTKGLRSFDVVFDDGATSYRWEKGAPTKRDPARKGVRYLFELRQHDDAWKVSLVGTYE